MWSLFCCILFLLLFSLLLCLILWSLIVFLTCCDVFVCLFFFFLAHTAHASYVFLNDILVPLEQTHLIMYVVLFCFVFQFSIFFTEVEAPKRKPSARKPPKVDA